MNYYIFTAAILIILLALIHSVLGEYLIFRHIRKDSHWIATGIEGLGIRRIRSLWATWHLLSILALGLSIILLASLTWPSHNLVQMKTTTLQIVSVIFGLATPFWLIGTKGKHPAWIVFLVISLLTWVGK